MASLSPRWSLEPRLVCAYVYTKIAVTHQITDDGTVLLPTLCPPFYLVVLEATESWQGSRSYIDYPLTVCERDDGKASSNLPSL